MATKAQTITARDLGRSAVKIDSTHAEQWRTLRVKAAALVAALPRKDGELDRQHDAFKAFRDEFGEGAEQAAAESGRYDLELHRAGENEFHLASADKPANYRLTGAAAMMTRADLAALPGADVAPFGLKRFVTLQRQRIKGAKDVAFLRLLEREEATEEMLAKQGAPRAAVSLAEKLGELYKGLESKRAKENQTQVCTAPELKAAIDALIKVALKK